MNEGFIKIDRKLLKWRWKTVPEMVALWVEILLQANYEGREFKTDYFEKGSFPTSLKRLADDTGLSVKQIRNGLKRLEQTGEIIVKRAHQGTKIIVVNWAQYQGFDPEEGKQRAQKGQTKGNSIRKKEGKKYIYNTRTSEETEVYDSSNNPQITEEQREAMRRRRA